MSKSFCEHTLNQTNFQAIPLCSPPLMCMPEWDGEKTALQLGSNPARAPAHPAAARAGGCGARQLPTEVNELLSSAAALGPPPVPAPDPTLVLWLACEPCAVLWLFEAASSQGACPWKSLSAGSPPCTGLGNQHWGL